MFAGVRLRRSLPPPSNGASFNGTTFNGANRVRPPGLRNQVPPPGLGKQRERSKPELVRVFLAPRRQGNPPKGCAPLRVQQSLMGETTAVATTEGTSATRCLPKTAPHFPRTRSGKQRRARNTGTSSGMLFLRAQRCFTCYNALVPAQRSGLPQRAALKTRPTRCIAFFDGF